MNEKSKRKNDSPALFKLKLTLLGFIIGTWLATLYPMIWLAPPLFQFTPFVYIGLSLLWIPLVWRVRWIRWDWLVKVMVAGCLFSSVMMTHVFETYQVEPVCRESNPQDMHIVQCKIYAGQCNKPTFIKIGNIMIAQDHPFNRADVFYYCLF